MQVLPSVSTRREEDEEAGEEGAREGGQAEACNGTGVRPLDWAVRHDSCTVQIFATRGAQRRIQSACVFPGALGKATRRQRIVGMAFIRKVADRAILACWAATERLLAPLRARGGWSGKLGCVLVRVDSRAQTFAAQGFFNSPPRLAAVYVGSLETGREIVPRGWPDAAGDYELLCKLLSLPE